MKAIIQKHDFKKIIEGVLTNKQVIAPISLPNDDLLYSYIENVEEISLDTTKIPIMSAKEFFLANQEELFSFEKRSSGELKLNPPPAPKETVFFGIRSCDVNGIRFLEQFFSGSTAGNRPYNDTTVTTKIEKTTFISIGCIEPPETCFCVCCDGGPFLISGSTACPSSDAQLIDLGDKFILEIFTTKGEELFSSYKDFLYPVVDEDLKKKIAILEKVDRKFKQRSYMSMGLKEISLNTVPEPVWELFGNRCISCGSCTYVCPTCSCFNVFDRETNSQIACGATASSGVRVRTWDSCSYSGFTREVSGHNPRPHSKDRLKQRFFHKLSYQSFRLNGRIGCVGCGRCVVSCPAQVDISSFVTSLREIKSKKV